jgi:hypothetical protein
MLAQRRCADGCRSGVGIQREQLRPEESALISHEALRALEAELNEGPSVAALRRFNQNLRRLTADNWREFPHCCMLASLPGLKEVVMYEAGA